jgi:hypothetical protein
MRAIRMRTFGELLLLAEAACWLAVAGVAAAALPFRIVLRSLGLGAGQPWAAADLAQSARAAELGQAVQTAAKHVPWPSRCLPQAVAVTAMLRCRRIPATLHLGASAGEEAGEGLAAHAWVQCADAIVTGGEERAEFTEVGVFGRR